jgi:phosphohistidine phosphatase SixA
MRRRVALLALIALPCVSTASADEDAAWAALGSSDAVIALVRHADAPGTGDPPGWRLDDCATQRNLGERGRADARKLGERLREARVPIAKVLSSPWCRCLDTARLMNVGAVQTEPTFSNAFVLNDRRDALAAGARDVLKAWRGPGTLLVVTHGANILALTGHSPASGELVVVSAGKDGALRVVGTLQAPR